MPEILSTSYGQCAFPDSSNRAKHSPTPKGVYPVTGQERKNNINQEVQGSTTNPYRLKEERLHPLKLEETLDVGLKDG